MCKGAKYNNAKAQRGPRYKISFQQQRKASREMHKSQKSRTRLVQNHIVRNDSMDSIISSFESEDTMIVKRTTSRADEATRLTQNRIVIHH